MKIDFIFGDTEGNQWCTVTPPLVESDQQWVLYHDEAWRMLTAQGYTTTQLQRRHGQVWALMNWRKP
jgi:hypothetical protein